MLLIWLEILCNVNFLWHYLQTYLTFFPGISDFIILNTIWYFVSLVSSITTVRDDWTKKLFHWHRFAKLLRSCTSCDTFLDIIWNAHRLILCYQKEMLQGRLTHLLSNGCSWLSTSCMFYYKYTAEQTNKNSIRPYSKTRHDHGDTSHRMVLRNCENILSQQNVPDLENVLVPVHVLSTLLLRERTPFLCRNNYLVATNHKRSKTKTTTIHYLHVLNIYIKNNKYNNKTKTNTQKRKLSGTFKKKNTFCHRFSWRLS